MKIDINKIKVKVHGEEFYCYFNFLTFILFLNTVQVQAE